MTALILLILAPPVVLSYTVGQAWAAAVGYAALVPVDVDPPGFGR